MSTKNLFPMSVRARNYFINGCSAFIALLERKQEFSLNTFGPGARLEGVLDHIEKEIGEIRANPGDIYEWVDVIALAMDGALRQGHSPYALLVAIVEKQMKVEGRKYPDWRTADPTKGIEHIREIPPPPKPTTVQKGGVPSFSTDWERGF